MGQAINVKAIEMGDTVVFDADRSLSGQDGAAFSSLLDTVDDGTFPAGLLRRQSG